MVLLTALPPKFLDLTIDHPAGPVLGDHLQTMVGAGILLFLVMWGVSKIIKAIRK